MSASAVDALIRTVFRVELLENFSVESFESETRMVTTPRAGFFTTFALVAFANFSLITISLTAGFLGAAAGTICFFTVGFVAFATLLGATFTSGCDNGFSTRTGGMAIFGVSVALATIGEVLTAT